MSAPFGRPSASQPEIEIKDDGSSSTLLINGQEMGAFGGYTIKADNEGPLSVTVTLLPSKLTIGP